MAKNKFYSVTKEINGTKYTAQFAGLSTALKATDSSYIDGTQNISTEKFGEFIFKNIIVEPAGLKADDFESIEEYNEVVTFGRKVMQGDFRSEANKDTAK